MQSPGRAFYFKAGPACRGPASHSARWIRSIIGRSSPAVHAQRPQVHPMIEVGACARRGSLWAKGFGQKRREHRRLPCQRFRTPFARWTVGNRLRIGPLNAAMNAALVDARDVEHKPMRPACPRSGFLCVGHQRDAASASARGVDSRFGKDRLAAPNSDSTMTPLIRVALHESGDETAVACIGWKCLLRSPGQSRQSFEPLLSARSSAIWIPGLAAPHRFWRVLRIPQPDAAGLYRLFHGGTRQSPRPPDQRYIRHQSSRNGPQQRYGGRPHARAAARQAARPTGADPESPHAVSWITGFSRGGPSRINGIGASLWFGDAGKNGLRPKGQSPTCARLVPVLVPVLVPALLVPSLLWIVSARELS